MQSLNLTMTLMHTQTSSVNKALNSILYEPMWKRRHFRFHPDINEPLIRYMNKRFQDLLMSTISETSRLVHVRKSPCEIIHIPLFMEVFTIICNRSFVSRAYSWLTRSRIHSHHRISHTDFVLVMKQYFFLSVNRPLMSSTITTEIWDDHVINKRESTRLTS